MSNQEGLKIQKKYFSKICQILFSRVNPVTKVMEAFVSGKERFLRITLTWAVVFFIVSDFQIHSFHGEKLFEIIFFAILIRIFPE